MYKRYNRGGGFAIQASSIALAASPCLPNKILFLDGGKITYTYDVGGRKLRTDYYINTLPDAVLQVDGGTGTAGDADLRHTWTDYCGNFVYENDSLKQTLIEGGYISYAYPQGANPPASTTDISQLTPTYHFYVRDHLGNNRLVVDEHGAIEQVNHYYPFGGLMGESQDIASTQRYKYNGKELDRMHGLDWYDYGTRHYDASIGRWMCVDPLVEKYHGISPYAYCLNNPIRYVDPDGKIVVIDKNSTKEFIDAVYLAINFLREKGCGEFYEVLNASPNVYTIKEATGEASSFSWKTRTVEWAYKYGLNTGFTILSPATRLNHDLDHAARYDNDPIGFLADIKPIKEGEPDEFYHTKDDKRVIMNSEKQTAEALGEIKSGEITRDSHSGVSIETISPISNKPKKPLIEFEIVAPIINKQDLK